MQNKQAPAGDADDKLGKIGLMEAHVMLNAGLMQV
jgi:hypothetical protein